MERQTVRESKTKRKERNKGRKKEEEMRGEKI